MGIWQLLFKKNGVGARQPTYEETCMKEYDEENRHYALQSELEKRIQEGDYKAYVDLSKFHENYGDWDMAFEYANKAIEYEVISAYTQLGHCYAKAVGTEKDEQKAMKCYELAAEHGDTDGLYWLGWSYLNGKNNVKVDKNKGMQYMLKAAKGGDYSAQAEVGKNFYLGIGVEKNGEEAFKWLYQAVKNSPSDCIWGGRYLGLCYLNGVGTPKDEKRGVELLEAVLCNSCESNVEIKKILADCYQKGIGTKKNSKLAQQYRNDIQRSSDLFDSIIDGLPDTLFDE